MMKITIEAESKEIADLVSQLQSRPREKPLTVRTVIGGEEVYEAVNSALLRDLAERIAKID